MPSWKELLAETDLVGSAQDVVRRRYLAKLQAHTGRNTILYYSAWLQKPGLARQGMALHFTDADKNGFMAALHGLDKSKGLDLILHTPGGDLAAMESLVDYLRSLYGKDIRAIVPQLAMSAGTMLALACKEIVMGKHSSLGPIDPQINGLPAHGILEEFKEAKKDILSNPNLVNLWGPILQKYSPALIGECDKAIKWAEEMAQRWLETGVFDRDPQAKQKAEKVVKELGDHSVTKSHSRHYEADKVAGLGLKVVKLEPDKTLQDLVLSVHHSTIMTLGLPQPFKIIENHLGVSHVSAVQLARTG